MQDGKGTAAESGSGNGASTEDGARRDPQPADEREERFLKEGISVRKGVDYAGGSLDVYLNLMDMFLREKEEREEKLRGFLETENTADYTVLVHALKSNARMLGAGQLSEIAFEHEKAGKAGQLTYIQEHWEELSREWARCRDVFDDLYREYRGEQEEKYARVTEGEPLEITQEALKEVIAWLDRFQTPDAEERMKEWLSCPLDPETHKKIRDALLAVEEEFDEEKAIGILRS